MINLNISINFLIKADGHFLFFFISKKWSKLNVYKRFSTHFWKLKTECTFGKSALDISNTSNTWCIFYKFFLLEDCKIPLFFLGGGLVNKSENIKIFISYKMFAISEKNATQLIISWFRDVLPYIFFSLSSYELKCDLC